MSAKVILTPKLISQPFDDRVILLDVPAKIGRSHKGDQAGSANALFDCKVLSKQHAMIIFEEGKFFLIDTGSSNGSFINNIRLSKSGEESSLTRVFSNDVLRFGSDVLDKARNATQKCIVASVKLFHPDGREEIVRPIESRLFRPNDTMEDLQAITQALKESLSKERHLEDKLSRIRMMISKNIGKTHTDLLRLFESMKQELLAAEETSKEDEISASSFEKIATENINLNIKIKELEGALEKEETNTQKLKQKQQEDSVEIITLKKACQLQRKDIEELEARIKDLNELLTESQSEAHHRLEQRIKEFERERAETMASHEHEMIKQEEAFTEERNKLKEHLHNVTSNEVNLLNRIKCLEAEEAYSHAEVERILIKERELNEKHQQYQFKIECLERNLQAAEDTIRDRESQVIVKRFDEDIIKIEEQEECIKKQKEEVGRLKQELIEARARKSASDDELNTIKGKLETLENNIMSLSAERETQRKIQDDTKKKLDEKIREADHLKSLVEKMEASSSQDEVIKTELADLKSELCNAEGLLRQRSDEILNVKAELKSKEETLQQKEIDLSVLRGQIQTLEEDLERRDEDTYEAEDRTRDDVDEHVMMKLEHAQERAEALETENASLKTELDRQQIMFKELKKMRGRGDEFELLKATQAELLVYQGLVQAYESGGKLPEGNKPTAASISPSEMALQRVGTMRVYELVIGLIFLLVIIDWTFFN